MVTTLLAVLALCPLELSTRAMNGAWAPEALESALAAAMRREVVLVGTLPRSQPTCDQLDVNLEEAIVTVTFRPVSGQQVQRVFERRADALGDVVRLSVTLAQQQLSQTLPDLPPARGVPSVAFLPPPMPALAQPIDRGLVVELGPTLDFTQRAALAPGGWVSAAWSSGLFLIGLGLGFRSAVGASLVEWPFLAEFGVTAHFTHARLIAWLSTGARLASGLSALQAWEVDWLVRPRIEGVYRLTERVELSLSVSADLTPTGARVFSSMGASMGVRMWVWP